MSVGHLQRNISSEGLSCFKAFCLAKLRELVQGAGLIAAGHGQASSLPHEQPYTSWHSVRPSLVRELPVVVVLVSRVLIQTSFPSLHQRIENIIKVGVIHCCIFNCFH